MGTVTGIVAEYNPFHLGHELHIQETRKHFGADSTVVAVMSGDFVQRGDVAVFSKYARAEAACRCGVDLVVELPVTSALSSAEGFAQGAVAVLQGLGGVRALSFGSECGDVRRIRETAEYLLSEEFSRRLKEHLKTERNFPRARELAVAEYSEELAEVLRSPNNTLAVEYAKAVIRKGTGWELFTVKRAGADHDSDCADLIPSAKALREALRNGDGLDCWKGSVPDPAWAVYQKEKEEGRGPVLQEDLEQALLSRLRSLSDDAVASLPDTDGGFGNRLRRALRSAGGLEEMEQLAKDRSITLSRVRRTLFCGALGITEERMRAEPSYVRILAFNEKGRALLHGSEGMLPRITRPAAVRQLGADAQESFLLGAEAHDLYVLGYSDRSRWTPGEDWTRGPAVCE